MTYTEPLLLVFGVWALAGILSKRRVVAVTGVLGLIVTALPAAEWVFSRPLESSYPVRPFAVPPDVQAIVVFSGGVEPPNYERPYAQPNRDTFERCRYAAWIYRKHPLPVLACGGGSSSVRHPPFSEAMREILVQNGVPEGMIWTEDKSVNTHENAAYAAGILRQHGIQRVALVVDARSMNRASACLRKEGVQVTPAPSRFRTWERIPQEFLPTWEGVKGNEETLHEVLGMIWYRGRGWL